VIKLAGQEPGHLQPIELLGAWAAQRGLNPQALMKLLIAGRLILIFEGFGEMAEAGNTEARLKHFRNLWRFCYPGSKLVFTGRPSFLLDRKERRVALGIDESSGSGPHCQAVRLSPFGSGQIRESLRWAPDRVVEEILNLAEKDQAFSDIVARPSLLFLVATLGDTPEFTEARRTRIDSATVIGLFVKSTLRRQTEKSRHCYHFMSLNESERAYFMDGIAAYTVHHKLPNQIVLKEFDEMVERLYEQIPEAVSKSPDARQSSFLASAQGTSPGQGRRPGAGQNRRAHLWAADGRPKHRQRPQIRPQIISGTAGRGRLSRPHDRPQGRWHRGHRRTVAINRECHAGLLDGRTRISPIPVVSGTALCVVAGYAGRPLAYGERNLVIIPDKFSVFMEEQVASKA